MHNKAILMIDGKQIELPIMEGTRGDRAIDVSRLRQQSGMVTYDPGLANTATCQSAITYIDGEKGILCYRGIPIEQLAQSKSNFVEIAWLLMYGRLPDKEELSNFSRRLTENELLNEAMKHHFEGFPVTAPPMAMLSA